MFDKFAQEDEKLEIQRKVHQQQEKARLKAAKKSAGKSDKPDEAGDVPVSEPDGGDVPLLEPNGGDVPMAEPNVVEA
uniref:Uncharacterized protein n=1 Tax=Ciona savignyi TaxID=51511 RepID=H2YKI6_CIOSA